MKILEQFWEIRQGEHGIEAILTEKYQLSLVELMEEKPGGGVIDCDGRFREREITIPLLQYEILSDSVIIQFRDDLLYNVGVNICDTSSSLLRMNEINISIHSLFISRNISVNHSNEVTLSFNKYSIQVPILMGPMRVNGGYIFQARMEPISQPTPERFARIIRDGRTVVNGFSQLSAMSGLQDIATEFRRQNLAEDDASLTDSYVHINDSGEVSVRYIPKKESNPKISQICYNCRYFCGRKDGGNTLVCALFPYGNGEDCADFVKGE